MPVIPNEAGVRSYFQKRFDEFGATPQGMDWNSTAAAEHRFDQLVKVCDPGRRFSILDYGCGYGALIEYMAARGYRFDYQGYDLLQCSVEEARRLHPGIPEDRFTAHEESLEPADYLVASGVLSLRCTTPIPVWQEFVSNMLDRFDQLSRSGFAFNLLTSYSDPERKLNHLYYADPCELFDRCIRRYSRRVALLHDYPIYDFTILVRK